MTHANRTFRAVPRAIVLALIGLGSTGAVGQADDDRVCAHTSECLGSREVCIASTPSATTGHCEFVRWVLLP
jgi:hypothetical protein